MKFNYHAVSKKDRIIKTLVLGTPSTIIIGLLGSLAIIFANKLGLSFFYYAVVLGIGYVVGTMVRKVGRGLTSEFLIIAGVFTVIAVVIAMYLSFILSLTYVPIIAFVTNFIGLVNSQYSLIEIIFAVVVAISQATVGNN